MGRDYYTPEQRAEFRRNGAIIVRSAQLKGTTIERTIGHQVYLDRKSDRACKGLDLRAWELTFPRVFVWHKESKRPPA